MPQADPSSGANAPDDVPAVQCDECESALRSDGRRALGFLLVDQLTVPLVGCDDHLEAFASVCGLTTEDAAELLHHRPAGGLPCPSCHLAPYRPGHPLVPVEGGAVAIPACPDHQSETIERFQTGLRTRQQLTADPDTSPSS